MARAPLPANVRHFLAFRVLFNARFYYPVLAILFVDLGLTLDRYALLNVAWAASIVLFELPLGALADRIGRRPLLVVAATLMVVEMAVLAFAPTDDPDLLFLLFLFNRVLSGLAEAAASGADEALAYDTLVAQGRRAEWPRVLSLLQRRSAIAFILNMSLGAAVYDAGLVSAFLQGLGLPVQLEQIETTRVPVYLTLVMACGALAATLRMREPETGDASGDPTGWRGVMAAGGWIVRTRFALGMILFALVLDSIVRLFLTLNSSYYRMVGIPEATFGLLGAAFSGLAFFSPLIANRLLRRGAPLPNLMVVALLMLAGLAGIGWVPGPAGALFVALLAIGFHLLQFFSSHYLNAVTASSRRATVLSFKSLAGNLAYGAAGWAYALLFRALAGGEHSASGSAIEETVLAETLRWLPFALGLLLVPLLVFALRIPRMLSRETFDS
jgi:predicted MFS family arabinose efflux permease